MPAADLNSIKDLLTEKFQIVRDEFRKNGIGQFKVPLIVGVLGLYSGYVNFYSPVFGKQKKVRFAIEAVRVQAEVADLYRPAKSQELLSMRRFPKPNSKDWLGKTMQKIFDEEGVVPRSMGTPTEADLGDYILMTMQVSLATIPFNTYAKIVEKVENSQIFIKITDSSIIREQGPVPGQPLVSPALTVSTILPKEMAK